MYRFNHLITFLLLAASLSVSAATKTSPTFSGRYKNKSVKEVLADLKSETGTTVRLQKKQVPSSRKVNVTFRNATPQEVLEELFDCKHEIILLSTSKKGVRKYEVKLRDLTPHESVYAQYVRDTIPLDNRVIAQQESEREQITILTRENRSQVRIEDSIRVTQDRVIYHETEGAAKQTTPVGFHSLQAYIGGAYSSLGYRLQDGKNLGGLGGEVSLRYAYFFNDNWGLGIGLDYDLYQSSARLNTLRRWDGVADSETELYNHLTYTHDWTENQQLHELSVPLVAEFQHRFSNGYGIFAALGAYAGFQLNASYKLSKGSLEHQGDYPQWGLVLDAVRGHDFYTETIGEDFAREKKQLSLAKITTGIKADLGAIIPLTEQIDLFAGVYAKVDVLDLSAAEPVDLGWRQTEASETYRQHNFMPEYEGLLASNYVSGVRPYQVGIKVGIHFQPAPPAPKTKAESLCELITDTTYRSQFHYDTIRTQSVDTIVSLRQTLRKSVIWFALNDYQHPRIEPSDLLEQVAAILKANPNQRIAINGHASAEGNARVNQQLSDRRANTVAQMLIQLGVSPKQVVATGFSSKVDYVSDHNHATQESGRTQAELNRRVEIIPVND